MSKETLALILVMGIAGLVILAFVLNDAYADHPLEGSLGLAVNSRGMEHYPFPRFTDRAGGEAVYVLEHILEEEKKQTALLDQMNCYTYYEYTGGYSRTYNSKAHKEFCGEPLNLTGVWNP